MNVNNSFNAYRNLLINGGEDDMVNEALNKYIADRKFLKHQVLKQEYDPW